MAKITKQKSQKNKSKFNEKKNMKNHVSQEDVQSLVHEDQAVEEKTKSSKLYYIIGILVLLGFAVYFGVQKYGNLLVVSTVNGKPITRFALWSRLEKQTGKQVLEQMVSESLIEQEASSKGIKIEEKEIDAKIKALETQFKGKAGLEQVLSLQGMTLSDLRTQLKYNLIVEKIAPKASVSDKEVSDYYNNNQEQYGEELTGAVKKQIEETILQQKRSTVITTWFESLKKKAKINNYL